MRAHPLHCFRKILPVLLLILSCGAGCEAWNPVDPAIVGTPVSKAIFTDYVQDATQDPEDSVAECPPDGPQYLEETDIEKVSCAVLDGRIYVHLKLVGTLSNQASPTGYNSEVLDDRVYNIGIDVDNSTSTGFASWGMDIHMTFRIYVGDRMTAYYGVYEQNENSTAEIARFDGLIHAGGLGSQDVIISAPLDALGYLNVNLAPGDRVKIMGWAEAGSTNYHHYSTDILRVGYEEAIEISLGGE